MSRSMSDNRHSVQVLLKHLLGPDVKGRPQLTLTSIVQSDLTAGKMLGDTEQPKID